MRQLSIVLALAGLLLSAALVAWFDAGQVLGSVMSIGWGGFAVLVLVQFGLFALLGLAWSTTLPGVARNLLIWGRMVRDAATTCLPFSPVGGFVIGARAITLHGVAWPVAAASTVVDVTAEVLAQFAFAVFGLCVLIALQPGTALAGPLGAALACAGAAALVLVRVRGHVGRLVRRLGAHISGGWFPEKQAGLDRMQAELGRLYSQPGRIAAATVLHLAGWFGTGIGTWIAYRLLGADIGLLPALATEALLDAMVAAAFIVPGAAGVQEAGYAGIGLAFGIPPELSLGVSLLRRARDLAVGLPILLAWQAFEMRRLRVRRAG